MLSTLREVRILEHLLDDFKQIKEGQCIILIFPIEVFREIINNEMGTFFVKFVVPSRHTLIILGEDQRKVRLLDQLLTYFKQIGDGLYNHTINT